MRVQTANAGHDYIPDFYLDFGLGDCWEEQMKTMATILFIFGIAEADFALRDSGFEKAFYLTMAFASIRMAIWVISAEMNEFHPAARMMAK